MRRWPSRDVLIAALHVEDAAVCQEKAESYREACQRWRADHGHSPVLYVVPLEGPPDPDARAVVAAFEATGFETVQHAGPVVVSELRSRAIAARASAMLLCPGAERDLRTFRQLVIEVRDSRSSASDIFDVLFVGVEPEDVREGDRGLPFLVHPSEGRERMLWVAQFVARSVGVRPAE